MECRSHVPTPWERPKSAPLATWKVPDRHGRPGPPPRGADPRPRGAGGVLATGLAGADPDRHGRVGADFSPSSGLTPPSHVPTRPPVYICRRYSPPCNEPRRSTLAGVARFDLRQHSAQFLLGRGRVFDCSYGAEAQERLFEAVHSITRVWLKYPCSTPLKYPSSTPCEPHLSSRVLLRVECTLACLECIAGGVVPSALGKRSALPSALMHHSPAHAPGSVWRRSDGAADVLVQHATGAAQVEAHARQPTLPDLQFCRLQTHARRRRSREPRRAEQTRAAHHPNLAPHAMAHGREGGAGTHLRPLAARQRCLWEADRGAARWGTPKSGGGPSCEDTEVARHAKERATRAARECAPLRPPGDGVGLARGLGGRRAQ